jgi:hypothetical protein
MCGIFGGVSDDKFRIGQVRQLATRSSRRGKDSSGLAFHDQSTYRIERNDGVITKLIPEYEETLTSVVVGHSRLITNGLQDNQPVVRDNIIALHNGIILNAKDLWKKISARPSLQIDTEIINALVCFLLKSGLDEVEIGRRVLDECIGVVNCCIIIPERGSLILMSNNGSLFLGRKDDISCFASEKFFLEQFGCGEIQQISGVKVLEIPVASSISESGPLGKVRSRNLIPPLRTKVVAEEALLQYKQIDLVRCKTCILPESMPFIVFDSEGTCNYCHNYVKRNQPRSVGELEALLEPHKSKPGPNCIVPFSGGRDSSFGLHLVANRFGLKPVAYTYDWGMVTDLGRRNISLMCSKLGVENIVVAADIEWKRKNIRKNLLAWLKEPHLGLLSLLTAGDKHFFRFIERIKRETGVPLNIWSVNPLEVTHFKAGLLGVRPDFAGNRVYQTGWARQYEYQAKRFAAMRRNRGYFNSSLVDTLSGEFFRSKAKDEHYIHLFDFWKWNEHEIEAVLDSYGWERAEDTATTWRIGDGTAAFYNYIHHRVLGFSEHDTFRSNQIREGDISRDEALRLVNIENQPRYQNIRWYLEVLQLSFSDVIERVNSIPRFRGNS